MSFLVNTMVSATVIALAAWIAHRAPSLAGLLVALPISTMLVLPLVHLQDSDGSRTLAVARGIFFAIPVALFFVTPFLVAGRLDLTFWQSYVAGCAILIVGCVLHRFFVRV